MTERHRLMVESNKYLDDMFKYSVANIEAFENEISRKQPQVEIPIKHYFANGVYAREITIPAGVILTGDIHKFENLNILSKGTMRVSVGDEMLELSAPRTIVSPPGTKRIAYTLTECVWTTILATNETNVELIKQQFTVATEQEWLEYCGHNQSRLFG